MTVTEFALLRLQRDGHGDNDLYEALLQCIEIQDQWIDVHKPHLRAEGENLSNIFLERDGDAPYLLITAPWDSPAGHREWIQSKENQEAMGRLLSPYLAEDDSMQVYHLEPAGSNRRLLLDDVVPRTPFNVCSLSIDPANKAAVQEEYHRLEEELVRVSSRRQIWAGWRIESDEDRDSLVVFWDPTVQSSEVESFLKRYERKGTRSFKCMGNECVCKM